ncbi:MAG: hypothetical protein HFJ38_08065, partial [Bacilli bacterium]|nr:hypothetical protein [Bacilli bacterium]
MTITIGGTAINYKVSVGEDGKSLQFDMDPASVGTLTTDDQYTGDFSVGQLTVDTAANGVASGKINQKTQVIKEGSASSDTILANTQTNGITFDENFFTDGKAIKVGDETYVFALTDKTANAKFGAGYKVVDVRDLVDPTTDKIRVQDANGTATKVYLSNALTRLSEVAKDNKMFSVGVEKDADLKLSFQEKSTYDGDAKLDTNANIQKQLQFYNSVSVVETTIKGKGSALTLQIGDTSESFNQLKVSIGDIHAAALGVASINVGNQTDAGNAIDVIKNAINTVSSIRGTLGATQNRLEHTANNLSVMTENIQDAESTIRDTDIAEEMMAYTKNNI